MIKKNGLQMTTMQQDVDEKRQRMKKRKNFQLMKNKKVNEEIIRMKRKMEKK